MQRKIGHKPSGNSSAQTDAVDQHQPLDTLGRTEGEPKCECPAHGQTDEYYAFQTQSIQKVCNKINALLNTPIARHRVAFTKTRPVGGEYAVLLCKNRNRLPKTKSSRVKPATVQNHNRLAATSRSQTMNTNLSHIKPQRTKKRRAISPFLSLPFGRCDERSRAHFLFYFLFASASVFGFKQALALEPEVRVSFCPM